MPFHYCEKASQHFGGLLSQFIGDLAAATDITQLPKNLRRACIAHGGTLTPLYEYISSMRNSGMK